MVFFGGSIFAQQVPNQLEDPAAEARVHFGIVALDPSISVSNVGIDTNVFNSGTNPQSDFTYGVRPGSELWLRTGRGLLSVDGWLEYVHFNEFASERSWNSHAKGQYEWRFNRFRPYASASTLNTRERPGFEIDARARRYETEFTVGTDFRIASKSVVGVDFRQQEFTFAGDEIFNGRPLNEQLNRTLRAAQISWRQRLTALTTWVTRVSRETERFAFQPIRNSDSFRATSGFELGRFALIRGSAFLGFRTFEPVEGGQFAAFSGLITNVNVAYTAPTQTRLSATVDRDIQYSYETITPYYVQTEWSVSVTQRMSGRWDAQLKGGRARLAYQAFTTRDSRTDFMDNFGGGIGYALGDQVRASFDVQSFYRSSVDPRREYGGLRAGVSVNYGY